MIARVIPCFIRRCFVLLALTAASFAFAQDLTLTPINTGWHDAASFKRISEYFSGRENTGGITTLRSRAEDRSGYYLMLRAYNSGAATTAKIVLQVVMPADQDLRTFTFQADLKAGKTLLHLGLTGADWPDAKTNPVAWKIDVFAADGKLLTSEKSFLWDKPPGK